MDREELERTFLWKVDSEVKLFQYRMLQKSRQEIYNLAYQIDCVLHIYAILKEYCKEMTVEELEVCMFVPEILIHLYWRWVKVSDSQQEELKQSIITAIQEKKGEAA